MKSHALASALLTASLLSGCGGGGDTTPPADTDVATAKAFFSNLRSNAYALSAQDPLNTGIVDGVKAFGDSLNTEAASLTLNTAQVVQLGDVAQSLWRNYTTGQTTDPFSPGISGFPGGCAVFQGTFPTLIGGTGGANGAPYSGTAVTATSTTNASWVGCSVNSGPLPTDGTSRYRQTIVFNMSADPSLAAVPYVAITRAQYIDAGVTYHRNLTPTLVGTAGFTLANGDLMGFSFAGDLPPPAMTGDVLLAARYAVDIDGLVTQLPSGAFQASFSSGKLGVVAVGATEVGLSIDFSPEGASVVVIPENLGDAAQVAEAKLNIEASISDAKGRLAGTLLIDQLSVDTSGRLVPGHAKFTGEIGAAPVVNGTPGSVVTFLSGSLEATLGSTPVVSFNGSMALPNRPVASLTVTVTETSVTDGTLSLQGSYTQAGVTVTMTGTKSSTDSSVTFADSTGVSTTVTSHSATANVTVSGRQTAVIDKANNRIDYKDGTFESVF
ncbi:MAG TPA: hypothetical protein VGJ65_00435 [Albitalea sp.]|jgi:hypothetical protein